MVRKPLHEGVALARRYPEGDQLQRDGEKRAVEPWTEHRRGGGWVGAPTWRTRRNAGQGDASSSFVILFPLSTPLVLQSWVPTCLLSSLMERAPLPSSPAAHPAAPTERPMAHGQGVETCKHVETRRTFDLDLRPSAFCLCLLPSSFVFVCTSYVYV
eukprot:scaffold182225_cov31-Tisochrysis_lutea.AAC.1